jgi:hypothetical protein
MEAYFVRLLAIAIGLDSGEVLAAGEVHGKVSQ